MGEELLILSIKDILLNIASFSSLKQLTKLKLTCKTFNSWLSEPLNYSWKKRIKDAFPNTFEDILKLDIKRQYDLLIKFDSLIDEGHSVSEYYFPNIACDNAKIENMSYTRTSIHQIPWSKNLFIIRQLNNVHLFDSLKGSLVGQFIIPEWKEIGGVFFDYQSKCHIISFLCRIDS